MFDYNSSSFKRSLTEAIAWCAGQSLTAHPEESGDIRHRRALVDESTRLFRTVFERFNRDWDKVGASAEWRQAQALHKEADLLTLSTLDAQLRSAALKPRFQLDEFKDDLWDKAVSEVVAKRSAQLSNVSISGNSQTLAGGRLLEFIPSETLTDGRRGKIQFQRLFWCKQRSSMGYLGWLLRPNIGQLGSAGVGRTCAERCRG